MFLYSINSASEFNIGVKENSDATIMTLPSWYALIDEFNIKAQANAEIRKCFLLYSLNSFFKSFMRCRPIIDINIAGPVTVIYVYKAKLKLLDKSTFISMAIANNNCENVAMIKYLFIWNLPLL